MRLLLLVALCVGSNALADEICRAEAMTVANYHRYIAESQTEDDRIYYSRGLASADTRLAQCMARVQQQAADVETARVARAAAVAADTEKLRQEQAELEAERAERQHAIRDPKLAPITLGAVICEARVARADTLAEIAQERKYARIGGVVNLRKMHDLQIALRSADDDAAKARRRLTTQGTKPATCSDQRVRALLACRKSDNCGGEMKAMAYWIANMDALDE